VTVPAIRTIHSAHHHCGWDNSLAPVATVAPGDTIHFECLDAAGGFYDARSTAADAAGLLRAGGADAITSTALASKAGFRGTTGIFRFDAQGNVERRHAVYRIKNGKIRLLAEAANGF
jgi:hypothetical protein